MAYDSDTSTVTDSLKDSSTAVFSDATINQILALSTVDSAGLDVEQVEVPSGQSLVTLDGEADITFLTLPPDTPITLTGFDFGSLILQGSVGANLRFVVQGQTGGATPTAATTAATHPGAPDATADRVVVGTAHADTLTFADGINTYVVIGDGDTVITGNAYDTVVAAEGHSTVTGGSAGNTVVKAAGNTADYTVTVADGAATFANATTGVQVTVENIQYVALDDNEALVFAADANEASIATLYHGIFGRHGDAYGLQFYFDAVDRGATLKDIAASMLSSTEYAARGGVTNTYTFLTKLVENILGRDATAAELTDFNAKLAAGSTRADIAAEVAELAGDELASGSGTEVNIVGGITVVEGILG